MARDHSTRAEVHRDLFFDRDDHQLGDDVTELQKEANERIKNGNLPLSKLKVDGDAGRQTIAVCREIGRCLGLQMTKPGVSIGAQRIIRNPDLRTAEQRARAKKYTPPPRAAQPRVSGNKVTGGTPRQRVTAGAMQAAHLYYTGEAKRFYSQSGPYTVDKVITGEAPGKRSDCSQFAAGLHSCAGLQDPNGEGYTGGYTGTLGARGTYIKRIDLRPGDKVLYGPAPHHHVEVWVGNGDGTTTYRELADENHPDHAMRDRTVGHGSPPVDFGDIDMIGDPRFSRSLGLS